jgi:hypothetical protein
MANSAQFTSSQPYTVPGNFMAGFANRLAIPIPASVALVSNLNNFTINSNNNLTYSGTTPAKISLSGLICLGGFIPSQIPPAPLSLDSGPKVALSFFAQVNASLTNVNLVGNVSSLKLTYYYPQFEWPATYQATTLDIFDVMPGDVITFWAYYEWIVPPVAPVDPATFYVNITKCNLSLTVFSASSIEAALTHTPDHKTNVITTPISAPIGDGINTKLYSFPSNCKGLNLVEIRMNITGIKAYSNITNSYAPLIVGINNYIYLAVNSNLEQQQLSYAFSGNQPFVSNGNTIFPSTLVTRLLVDLKEDDVISILYNADDVSILDPTSPAGFSLLTDGKLDATVDFNLMCTPALYPQATVRQTAFHAVTIPVDSSTVEFSFTDSKVNSSIFELDNKNNLVYTGKAAATFKLRANFFINNLTLNNSNGDVTNVDLVNLGFTIGSNGRKVTNLVSESEVYTSVGNTFSLPTTIGMENVFTIHPGDYISILMYANNVVYTTTPPLPGVTTEHAAKDSTITLTGTVLLVIE